MPASDAGRRLPVVAFAFRRCTGRAAVAACHRHAARQNNGIGGHSAGNPHRNAVRSGSLGVVPEAAGRDDRPAILRNFCALVGTAYRRVRVTVGRGQPALPLLRGAPFPWRNPRAGTERHTASGGRYHFERFVAPADGTVGGGRPQSERWVAARRCHARKGSKITPIEKITPPEAEALAARRYNMPPRVRITDLLSD